MAECAELVQNAPQGPDVTFAVVGSVFAHFRRKVVGSAYSGRYKVLEVFKDLCDAEVADSNLVVFGQEDVQRL